MTAKAPAGAVCPCSPPDGEAGVGLCWDTPLVDAARNIRRLVRHCNEATCPCPHHEQLVHPYIGVLNQIPREVIARSVGLDAEPRP